MKGKSAKLQKKQLRLFLILSGLNLNWQDHPDLKQISQFTSLASFFDILMHLDEIIPIITPIIMLNNINKALGVFTIQNHSLSSTTSVFCKAKITNSSESKIITIILNFIVYFFLKYNFYLIVWRLKPGGFFNYNKFIYT
jgi:hypothetical protein